MWFPDKFVPISQTLTNSKVCFADYLILHPSVRVPKLLVLPPMLEFLYPFLDLSF